MSWDSDGWLTTVGPCTCNSLYGCELCGGPLQIPVAIPEYPPYNVCMEVSE